MQVVVDPSMHKIVDAEIPGTSMGLGTALCRVDLSNLEAERTFILELHNAIFDSCSPPIIFDAVEARTLQSCLPYHTSF